MCDGGLGLGGRRPGEGRREEMSVMVPRTAAPVCDRPAIGADAASATGGRLGLRLWLRLRPGRDGTGEDGGIDFDGDRPPAAEARCRHVSRLGPFGLFLARPVWAGFNILTYPCLPLPCLPPFPPCLHLLLYHLPNPQDVLLADHPGQEGPAGQGVAGRALGRQEAGEAADLLHRHLQLGRLHRQPHRPSGPASLRPPPPGRRSDLLAQGQVPHARRPGGHGQDQDGLPPRPAVRRRIRIRRGRGRRRRGPGLRPVGQGGWRGDHGRGQLRRVRRGGPARSRLRRGGWGGPDRRPPHPARQHGRRGRSGRPGRSGGCRRRWRWGWERQWGGGRCRGLPRPLLPGRGGGSLELDPGRRRRQRRRPAGRIGRSRPPRHDDAGRDADPGPHPGLRRRRGRPHPGLRPERDAPPRIQHQRRPHERGGGGGGVGSLRSRRQPHRGGRGGRRGRRSSRLPGGRPHELRLGRRACPWRRGLHRVRQAQHGESVRSAPTAFVSPFVLSFVLSFVSRRLPP